MVFITEFNIICKNVYKIILPIDYRLFLNFQTKKMTTIKLSTDWIKQFFNCQLSNLKLPSFLATLSCLLVSFLLQFNTANAQFTGCGGCTANDDHVDSVVLVQLNPAYTPDNGQPQFVDFPPICSGNSTVIGYLKIAFNQNATTRYGISLAGNILVDSVYSSTFSYCDPAETNSGPFVKYITNFPITFTCGTQLSLQNLFIGWGNSAGNNVCPLINNSVCPSNPNDPHCEQLPLTPGGPPIIIVTPLSVNFSYTGSCSATQTAQSYSFNALDPTNGTTGGTPPYSYSWTIVRKSNSVQVGSTLTGSNPSFNFSPFGPDIYTVTLTITDAATPAVVSSISKDITVTSCCTHTANAGTNGTLTVCAGTTPTDAQLFGALGGTPDAGGSWSNSGNVYTYTVTATAPCTGNATATVTVTTQARPNAGTNGTLTVCAGTTPTDDQLLAALGGAADAGGSWSNSGNVYTYTVAATAPCTTAATSTVTVSTQAAPNAGTNGTLTICAGTTPTDAQLFTQLGGTPDAGGSWTNLGNVYTYTVAATTPCTTAATATVTVTTQAQPNAGTNGTLTICAGTTPTTAQLLAALGGTPDAGGSWSNSGNVYTYTVAAIAPCTTIATATVTVTTQAQPNAGTNGILTVCAGTTPTTAQLFAVLTGTPTAGGSWTSSGNVYTYTVAATAPCTIPSTSTVTVTTQAPPNAGTNGTLTICAGTTPTNAQLFAALGGTPDAGGSWSNSGNVYTYTVGATPPCATAATATVTVTVNPNTFCATYSGDYFANTASTSTGGSAVVTLKYNISGTGSCNNLSGLTVSNFTIAIVSDPSIGSVVVVPGSTTYSGGVFTTKYTITLASSAYSGTVQFTLGLNNSNFSISADCSDNPLVTVSTMVTGFVTGGGFIIPVNSGGTIGGTPVNGLRNNFGFNIKSGKKLQGNWNTIIRRMENGHEVVYQVKSNTAATLVVTKITNTSWRADMSFTSANFQNLTCSLCPVNANNGTVLVSVYDNGEPGAGVDKILITIKDHSGNVWYTSDKAATNSITYTNLQLLNQGNIQIHTSGGAFALSTNTQISQPTASPLSVSAYPNPFTDKVTFSIVSPVSGKASLDIYNIMGQKLHNVYQGYLFAGRGQVIEYSVPAIYKGSLIYTLRVGDQQVNGKIVQIK